jgi:hypothetical protein
LADEPPPPDAPAAAANASEAARSQDAYRQKYVAFVDLLGFKRLVAEADPSPKKRRRVLDLLDLLRTTACENPSIGMRLTHFSDCVIMSADRSAPGLAQMLASIEWLALNLLQHDVLVRGGLAVGGAYHDSTFVFGLAVNEAHGMEECAVHPRVIVSDAVLFDARMNGLADALMEDEDGRHFVHYLRLYAGYDPNVRLPGTLVLEEPAARMIDFVCHRLNTHSGNVLDKAKWFQAYWNRKVATQGQFGRIEAGVRERVVTGGPTIVVWRVFDPGR